MLDSETLVTTKIDTMYPFQLRVQSKMLPGRRCLFLRYGSGKTWIALNYVDHMRQPGDHRRRLTAIIFCRKRNILTWKLEIHKRRRKPWIWSDIDGMTDLLEAPFNFEPHSHSYFLFPHHRIRTHIHELMKIIASLHPRALIMDESTVIKNPKTQVTKAALTVSESPYVPGSAQFSYR